ncbi:hypothetical protein D3C85_1456700 [compost metagenome]
MVRLEIPSNSRRHHEMIYVDIKSDHSTQGVFTDVVILNFFKFGRSVRPGSEVILLTQEERVLRSDYNREEGCRFDGK